MDSSSDANSMSYDFLDMMFPEASGSHGNHNLANSNSASSNSLNLHSATNNGFDMLSDLDFQHHSQPQVQSQVHPQLQHPSQSHLSNHNSHLKSSTSSKMPTMGDQSSNTTLNFPVQGTSDISNSPSFFPLNLTSFLDTLSSGLMRPIDSNDFYDFIVSSDSNIRPFLLSPNCPSKALLWFLTPKYEQNYEMDHLALIT